jgi:hypothetical protein
MHGFEPSTHELADLLVAVNVKTTVVPEMYADLSDERLRDRSELEQ